jgi:endogenous inhibitor of DNA gyrase (YacG/DUF329 family)
MSCPICGRKGDSRYRPFCSRRCADIDLGRWLTEGYAIPVDEPLDDAAETEAGSEDSAKGR